MTNVVFKQTKVKNSAEKQDRLDKGKAVEICIRQCWAGPKNLVFGRLSVISNWSRSVFGHLKKFFGPFGHLKKNSGLFRSYMIWINQWWVGPKNRATTQIAQKQCILHCLTYLPRHTLKKYTFFGFGLFSVIKSVFGHFRSFPIFLSVRFRSY